MPPPMTRWKPLTGFFWKSGQLLRPLKSVLTPMKTVGLKRLSSLESFDMFLGSVTRSLSAPMRSISRQLMVSANTW